MQKDHKRIREDLGGGGKPDVVVESVKEHFLHLGMEREEESKTGSSLSLPAGTLSMH